VATGGVGLGSSPGKLGVGSAATEGVGRGKSGCWGEAAADIGMARKIAANPRIETAAR
jgi:hypothetical protein